MSKFLKPIQWKNDSLVLLDQTLLPVKIRYLRLTRVSQVWEAIKKLSVRGAPAIGVAAAFGMYLALRNSKGEKSFFSEAQKSAAFLNSARPTAVNLRWATDRVLRLMEDHRDEKLPEILRRILSEARHMVHEDEEICRSIGRHGLKLLRNGSTLMTHCNAGGLATTGYGTALAPVYAAKEKGVHVEVFAGETRPLLQGARLTALELQRAGVPVTLICDNMAAAVMALKKVDLIIVGADRVVANGDFANKIGTYSLAILAREHGVPFYCATPLSTIDLKLTSGTKIPIEERSHEEITRGFGRPTAPKGIGVFNPAFDVTPHRYITGFITEKGIVKPPFKKNLKALFKTC